MQVWLVYKNEVLFPPSPFKVLLHVTTVSRSFRRQSCVKYWNWIYRCSRPFSIVCVYFYSLDFITFYNCRRWLVLDRYLFALGSTRVRQVSKKKRVASRNTLANFWTLADRSNLKEEICLRADIFILFIDIFFVELTCWKRICRVLPRREDGSASFSHSIWNF